jgi:hypothetical protein
MFGGKVIPPGKGFSMGDKYSKMGLGIFWGNKLKWHVLRNKPHDKCIHVYRDTQLQHSVQK